MSKYLTKSYWSKEWRKNDRFLYIILILWSGYMALLLGFYYPEIIDFSKSKRVSELSEKTLENNEKLLEFALRTDEAYFANLQFQKLLLEFGIVTLLILIILALVHLKAACKGRGMKKWWKIW